MPNAQYHFAAGDIVSWSGIRRCGGAMHMGQYVAENVHAHMLKEVAGVEPTWKELSEFPAVIGLAVGKKAVIYGPEEGTQDGEDLMKVYFGQDLGFQSRFSYANPFLGALNADVFLKSAGTTCNWAKTLLPRRRVVRQGNFGFGRGDHLILQLNRVS